MVQLYVKFRARAEASGSLGPFVKYSSSNFILGPSGPPDALHRQINQAHGKSKLLRKFVLRRVEGPWPPAMTRLCMPCSPLATLGT